MLAALAVNAVLAGCVVGYGPCLLLEPVKHTFTGHVHFRNYPEAGGVDNVPILVLGFDFLCLRTGAKHALSVGERRAVGGCHGVSGQRR